MWLHYLIRDDPAGLTTVGWIMLAIICVGWFIIFSLDDYYGDEYGMVIIFTAIAAFLTCVIVLITAYVPYVIGTVAAALFVTFIAHRLIRWLKER